MTVAALRSETGITDNYFHVMEIPSPKWCCVVQTQIHYLVQVLTLTVETMALSNSSFGIELLIKTIEMLQKLYLVQD